MFKLGGAEGAGSINCTICVAKLHIHRNPLLLFAAFVKDVFTIEHLRLTSKAMRVRPLLTCAGRQFVARMWDV